MAETLKKDELETAEEIMEAYGEMHRPFAQEDIVRILREIQEAAGCIPLPVQQKVAEFAGVGLPMVSCLVKMYPSLRAENTLYTVTVCSGGTCARKTAEIIQGLKKKLRFDKRGISADGRVALRTRQCLKNCRTAPNVLINGRLCANATVQKILNEINKDSTTKK